MDDLDCLSVNAYLKALADGKMSEGTLRVARCAIQALFTKRNTRERLILSRSEIEFLLNALPLRYHAILDRLHTERDSKKVCKKHGVHHNSLHVMLRKHGCISVQGFKRSLILLELADGGSFSDVSRKYGVQSVKTACVDFLKERRKLLSENLK